MISEHKYCELVMKEKGIEMLQAVIADPRPYDEIKDLAKQVGSIRLTRESPVRGPGLGV